MTVLRLHFTCDEPGQVGAVIAQTQVELARVRASNFPEVTVVDCEGPHTGELRPPWLGEVDGAQRGALRATVEQEQRGRFHHLVIEISDEQGA